MTAPLRLLFAGTPEIALFSLDSLLKDERRGRLYEVAAVLTNPDRPAGRRKQLTPPPVKRRAEEYEIPVIQPERLDGDARDLVATYAPDLLVSVAYGRIFGPKFMAIFPRGGINMHPSLLPRHRGPSPLQAAILAGDDVTGVTIQYIAPEMDSGAIISQERVPLIERTTVAELHDDLGARGGRLLVDAVAAIADGTVSSREQDHAAATYCGKLTKDDGIVTWRESAQQIDRMVRAFTPWPGVRVRVGDEIVQIIEALAIDAVNGGARLESGTDGVARETADTTERSVGSSSPAPPGTVLGVDNSLGILVQTTDGLLALSRLKPQARKEMDFRAFLNGNRDVVGTVLKQA